MPLFQVEALDATATDTVASTPGVYDGTGATLLYTGEADRTNFATVRVSWNAEITEGNIVRVHQEINSVLVPKFRAKLERKPEDAKSDWQASVTFPKLEITGTSQKIYISQEENDDLIAEVRIEKTPSTA